MILVKYFYKFISHLLIHCTSTICFYIFFGDLRVKGFFVVRKLLYLYSKKIFFRIRYLDLDFSGIKKLYNIKLFYSTLRNFKKFKKKNFLKKFFLRFQIFYVYFPAVFFSIKNFFLSLLSIRLDNFYLYIFYLKYKNKKILPYLDYITYMFLDFLVVWQYYVDFFFYYWYRNLIYRLYFILVEDYWFRKVAKVLAWSKIRNYSDKIEIFVEWVRLNVPGYEKAQFYEAELVIEWSIYPWCFFFFFYFYTTSPLGVLFLMEAFWTVKFWPKIFCHLLYRGYSKRFWRDRYWNKKWYSYPMWYVPYWDFMGDWRPFITHVKSPSQFYVYRYYYVKDFFIRWRIFYYILDGIYNVGYVSGGKEIRFDFYKNYPYYFLMLRSNVWPSTSNYTDFFFYKNILNIYTIGKLRFNFSNLFVCNEKFLFIQYWYMHSFKKFFKSHKVWFDYFKSEKTFFNLIYYIFYLLSPFEYKQLLRKHWFPLYWIKKIILMIFATGIDNPMLSFINRFLWKRFLYITGKKTESKHYFFYYKIDKAFIFYYLKFFNIFTTHWDLNSLELLVKSKRFFVKPLFFSNYNLPNLYFKNKFFLFNLASILNFFSTKKFFFDFLWNLKIFLKLVLFSYKTSFSKFRNNLFYNIYIDRLI